MYFSTWALVLPASNSVSSTQHEISKPVPTISLVQNLSMQNFWVATVNSRGKGERQGIVINMPKFLPKKLYKNSSQNHTPALLEEREH